jgi:hypothetical protein
MFCHHRDKKQTRKDAIIQLISFITTLAVDPPDDLAFALSKQTFVGVARFFSVHDTKTVEKCTK